MSTAEATNVSFSRKIQEGIVAMRNWNKERLKGSLKGAITRKKKEIIYLLNLNDQEGFDRKIKVERDLEKLLEEEESYWKIRSREDWLKCGDKKYQMVPL